MGLEELTDSTKAKRYHTRIIIELEKLHHFDKKIYLVSANQRMIKKGFIIKYLVPDVFFLSLVRTERINFQFKCLREGAHRPKMQFFNEKGRERERENDLTKNGGAERIRKREREREIMVHQKRERWREKEYERLIIRE